MTIHTFNVSAIISNEEYYNIQSELKKADPSGWKALINGMVYWGLSDKGIIINMSQVKKKTYFAYYISYRISARRVIENNNYIGLFNVKDYDELEEMVDEILKGKCSWLPKLKKCKLKRVDFCMNARLDSQKQVKAYIKTCKRANIPSYMEVCERYDKISKRRKPYKEDFTMGSDEYIEISIYNKYAEMKKEDAGVFPKKEIESTKDIVRIEIRCKEGKIQALKKSYNVNSIAGFMRRGEEIGHELYSYYLKKIFNEGTIWTLREALDRVDRSEYRKKDIELLKSFLKDCNNERSVAKALKYYRNCYGKTKVKRLITMLDDIDTNYVTVTNADVKLFDSGYIPTPYELYKEFME